MNNTKTNGFRALMVMFLALTLVFSPLAAFPAAASAEDGEAAGVTAVAGDAEAAGDTAAASISEIWVVPEVISGARQPASGGTFAWVTFDYYYTGDGLQNELNRSDFMLQMKLQGGEWTDVSGNNVAVMGGDDFYIASFEAIIAARVPDNNDPFIKKWRVVYKPDNAEERIESEIIVQAAKLSEDKSITVFDKTDCFDYTVTQAPWSYEDYQADKIPPIYIAHVYPDAVAGIKDSGFAAAGDHKIVLPWMYGEPWDLGAGGVAFENEYLSTMDTGLYLGTDSYSEETEGDGRGGGIADLVGYWKSLKEDGMWPGAESIPDAEALYNKIVSTVCVPDEDADEYLSYVVEGGTVFWVSGAGTEERVSQGVSDYILIIVRDWEAAGSIQHEWSEPEWTWAGSDEKGYTAANATFTCSVNGTHTRIVRAIIRCTSDEENMTYTAIASLDGNEYTDTKTVRIEEEAEQEVRPETKPVLKPAPVTISSKTVTASAVKKAVAAAAAKGNKPSEFIIGKSVKKISKNAFKGTGVTTLVVKSKRLTKKSVRGSLKGSKIKTVKVKVGSTKLNKKFKKKYKSIFTKKNAGKKVKVK